MTDDDASDSSNRKLLLLLLIPVALIVLLVVAVVGAAVIGAFVLDVGETQEHPPQVAWDWSDGDGAVTLEHQGGDAVTAPGQIVIYDSEGGPDDGADLRTVSGRAEIEEGDEIAIDVGDGQGTVRLIWEADDGARSTTISEFEYGE